ncbi:MAG: phosphatidate cytidylyltransferase, partial [Clostridia bacterium]
MVRVLSSIVMCCILLLVLYVLPTMFAVITVSIAIYLAILELLKATNNGIIKKYEKIFAILGAIVPFSLYAEKFSLLIVMFSAIFIVFLYLKYHEELDIKDVSFIILTGIILPQMLNTLARIFFLENGQFLILIPMITAWCSDIFAYVFGRSFGKRKLAPSISPNKTVEGSFGGIFGGVAGMLLFGYITKNFIGIPVTFAT